MNITVYLSSSTGNNSNKKSLALSYVKLGIYIICSQICFYKKRLNQQAQVMRLTMPRLCLRVQILFIVFSYKDDSPDIRCIHSEYEYQRLLAPYTLPTIKLYHVIQSL